MSAGRTERPTSRDRCRALELVDALRRHEHGVSVRELLVGSLAELLRASRGGSFSVASGGDRIRVHGSAVGLSAEAYAKDLGRTGGAALLFNPSRPEPAQQNVVKHFAPREQSPTGRALFARLGMADCWQLRVLVCDGPCFLAWVGVLREEPFTSRERLLLRSLVPALRDRFRLEQQVGDAPLALSALPAVLEAAGTAALVLRASGGVVLANASARALLDLERLALIDLLRAETTGRGPGRFAITRLALPGCPAYFLAVQRPRLPDPGPRAATFAARHALSARQAEVVSLVASGLANKAIAAHLRCAESTVEMHLTAIFARTQAESRAEVVARFWTGT